MLTSPVAVMISQHGGAQQYYRLLKKVSQAIEDRAKEVIATRTTKKDKRLLERILENAEVITEIEDGEMTGFLPPFVMIDGCDSERKAIDRMWPSIPKRVCQFHMMQAIRNYSRTVFGVSTAGHLKTDSALAAVREAQRCPDEARWEEYWLKLKNDITVIAGDTGRAWRNFKPYLLKHWFSERWRHYCVDYGIESRAFRDGAWSTNNYVESTFRTFDRVILCGRANKR
jgi:hypothetical protein